MNARVRPGRMIATAVVEDLTHDGRGVAHVEGKAVFIEDALPGEKVEWQLLKRGRNFDEGRLLRVLEASAERVVPLCRHFGVCGGCVLQHSSAAQQLAFKQRQLLESLQRIGHVAPQRILPPLQAGVWNYRRRARLAARWVPKKGRTVVGFRERSTTYITDVKRCEVLAPPVDALVASLSELLTALSVRDRVPQVEVAVGDEAIAFVIRVLQEPTAEDLDQLRTFQREHGVQLYLQPGGYETVQPLETGTLALSYRLPAYELTLHFEPTDFIQVNAALNALMIDRAVELLAPSEGERVLDLFCGLGNFSLPLARRAAAVVGVEGEETLVARARANAARNGLQNVRFYTANLADVSSVQAAWARQRYDKVLLDPPRAGAQDVLPLIARSGAHLLVYVSCHPGSLARDAGLLVNEHGYRMEAAGVMDMFPHTAHVESMAVFAKEVR